MNHDKQQIEVGLGEECEDECSLIDEMIEDMIARREDRGEIHAAIEAARGHGVISDAEANRLYFKTCVDRTEEIALLEAVFEDGRAFENPGVERTAPGVGPLRDRRRGDCLFRPLDTVPVSSTGTGDRDRQPSNAGPTAEERRRSEAQADAEFLATMPMKERSQYMAAQGWSDGRSNRARGALALREPAIRRDAQELQKAVDRGLTPEAWGVENGWSDARIAAAKLRMEF